MFENRSQQSKTEVKARIERSQNLSHEFKKSVLDVCLTVFDFSLSDKVSTISIFYFAV